MLTSDDNQVTQHVKHVLLYSRPNHVELPWTKKLTNFAPAHLVWCCSTACFYTKHTQPSLPPVNKKKQQGYGRAGETAGIHSNLTLKQTLTGPLGIIYCIFKLGILQIVSTGTKYASNRFTSKEAPSQPRLPIGFSTLFLEVDRILADCPQIRCSPDPLWKTNIVLLISFLPKNPLP